MSITAAEQYLLELINRARLDPLGEAARFGINVNRGIDPADQIAGTAMQVLVHNTDLAAAAQAHSQWMLAQDVFSHTGAGNSNPGQRMVSAGYEFTGSWSWGENISWSGTTGTMVLEDHIERQYDSLFLSDGHRANTLSDGFSEIGIAQVSGQFTSGLTYNASMLTEKFARSGTDVFLTGVAYTDSDGDDFYGMGEGLADAFVTVNGTTQGAGGAGNYTVGISPDSTASISIGRGSSTLATLEMDLSSDNGKLDLVRDTDGSYELASSASITLTSGAVDLRLLGVGDIDATGSTAANRIEGTSGDNVLGDGGGAGRDTLIGGAGDDMYVIYNSTTLIGESANRGYDKLASGVDFALSSDDSIEELFTTSWGGTGAVDLTGNGFTQKIIGNQGANTLSTGGASHGVFLRGGNGNDTYRVWDTDDDIYELSDQGNDRLIAATNFTLGSTDSIEVMQTNGGSGTANYKLYGNAFAQTITGNAGDNVLSDGGGAGDSLRGLDGDDIYIIRSSDTVIVESTGRGTADRVAAAVDYVLESNDHIELMTTTSSAGTSSVDLTGNDWDQRMVGNQGHNRLDGKGGWDRLTGGAGTDTFLFTTALGTDNFDRITDYNVADDRIWIDDAVFAGLSTGVLSASAFRAHSSGQAQDADDRIIYDTDSGYLYFDVDGTGSAGRIYFAQVDAGLSMTASEFLVI